MRLPCGHQSRPLFAKPGDFLFMFNAFIEIGQVLLVFGQMFQEQYCRRVTGRVRAGRVACFGGAGGLGRQLSFLRLLVLDFFFEGLVSLNKRRFPGQGGIADLAKFRSLGTHGIPGKILRENTARGRLFSGKFRRPRRRRGCGLASRGSLVIPGFMLFLHPLDDPSSIAARAIEILARVVQFTLVLIELRTGNVETLLERFLAAPLGSGHERGQPGDLLLVGVNARLTLFEACRNFARLRSQRRGVGVSIAERRGEGQIHGQVGVAQRLLREILLFAGAGEIGQLLYCLQGAEVHQIAVRRLVCFSSGCGAGAVPGQDPTHHCRCQQQHQSNEDDPLSGFRFHGSASDSNMPSLPGEWETRRANVTLTIGLRKSERGAEVRPPLSALCWRVMAGALEVGGQKLEARLKELWICYPPPPRYVFRKCCS